MDNQFTILIRDNLGRVPSKAEARAVAIAESQRSGLFATAFAKMAGIAPNTFWNWLHGCGLTQKRGFFKIKRQAQADGSRRDANPPSLDPSIHWAAQPCSIAVRAE
jgi:hypothetical protein